MAARTLVALPAALAALVGCSPQLDPNLARPCGARGEPAVVVGAGHYEFAYVPTEGLPIETDLTNGDYVWMAIGCRGLGPVVSVSWGIKDDLTGAVLTKPPDPLKMLVPLTYDSDFLSQNGPDRAEGLAATFKDPPGPGIDNVAQLVGRHVTFYANVSDVGDDCPAGDAGPMPLTAQDGQTSSLISGYNEIPCKGCLEGQCPSESAACTSECVALQACLDTRCSHLSKISSPEEVLCQIACEQAHPAGKAPLVGLARCLQTTTCQEAPLDCNPTPSITCQAPCLGYSIDYRHCTNLQDLVGSGPCRGALDACNGSPACVAYKACTTKCTTWAACQACSPDCSAVCASDGGVSSACTACNTSAEGRALYEAHQLCLEKTCLPQIWLPHLNSSSSLE